MDNMTENAIIAGVALVVGAVGMKYHAEIKDAACKTVRHLGESLGDGLVIAGRTLEELLKEEAPATPVKAPRKSRAKKEVINNV